MLKGRIAAALLLACALPTGTAAFVPSASLASSFGKAVRVSTTNRSTIELP